LSQGGKFAEAEACFRKALELDPRLPMGHNNLGWVREMQGDPQAALASYRKALEYNGALTLAQMNLATLLSRMERPTEASPVWHALVDQASDRRKLLGDIIEICLQHGSVETAAEFAERAAVLNRGSRWWPPAPGKAGGSAPPHPEPQVSIGKLQHDIEQFEYLRACGVVGNEFAIVIENYRRVLENVQSRPEKRSPLSEVERGLIGDVYGRIVYVRPTPRCSGRALSESWNPASVESECLEDRLGVVVIDDFLSQEAFEALRLFCLQSTVWFTNRYVYGRLGAFFRDGFNCPLLVQIADELKHAFPRLIGEKHRVSQIWGFKYGYFQPKTAAHADFSAVNVNFWLTPDDANLDKNSGGMVIYDVEAPLDWSFDSYNRQGDKIEAFLRQKSAKSMKIDYRANRAVIFNSDLFHATSPIRFQRDYVDRRINVTMLYGRRADARRI